LGACGQIWLIDRATAAATDRALLLHGTDQGLASIDIANPLSLLRAFEGVIKQLLAELIQKPEVAGAVVLAKNRRLPGHAATTAIVTPAYGAVSPRS
jgi:hypothetical protein